MGTERSNHSFISHKMLGRSCLRLGTVKSFGSIHCPRRTGERAIPVIVSKSWTIEDNHDIGCLCHRDGSVTPRILLNPSKSNILCGTLWQKRRSTIKHPVVRTYLGAIIARALANVILSLNYTSFEALIPWLIISSQKQFFRIRVKLSWSQSFTIASRDSDKIHFRCIW